MDEFTNYPLAPFINALRSVVGRVTLGLLAVILGVYLGGATGSQSFIGGFAALASFPSLIAASLFAGYGILVIPIVLFFIILFARSEWPLWIVAIVAALFWWSMHTTVHFVLHESAAAKMEKMVNDAVMEASRKAAESRSR